MAVLAAGERARIWRGLMRYWSAAETRADCALTKAELRAAVDAVDDWVDGNALAYNLALPAAARGSLTPGQKALLLALVALARYQPAALRTLVGEVD